MRKLSRKQKLFRAKSFLIFVILVSVFFILDIRIRPIAYELSSHMSKEIAVNTVNKTIEKLLNDRKNNFSNLTEIKYNSMGEISSVQTKVSEINLLQSQISQIVSDDFNKISDTDAELPIGTLSGFSLFNDMGPKIKIKIKPFGNIETNLASIFKNVGINQSNHQIILSIKANVSTIFPGYSQNNEINLNYILSDTVIVGNVPETYTYITGDNRDILSKNNDYK